MLTCSERVALKAEMTGHFVARVRERIGPGANARKLWLWLRERIESGDGVEYLGRCSAPDVRRFRFTYPDGRRFVAVVNTEMMIPITVLPGDEE